VRTVVIHFHPEQDERALLIHRLRNFGEEVWTQAREAEWGTVNLREVDRATTQFSVTDVHAKKLRRLTGWIQEKADLRNLRISIEVF
jgi:hypothetical protein